MRFTTLTTTILALVGQSLTAAASAPGGVVVTVNPDGKSVTVPVLSAADYVFNPDTKAAHHALRVRPISSEEADVLILSGQGVAPAEYKETATLNLSKVAIKGTKFLISPDDEIVSELLHKRSDDLPGRVRRAVVGTSSLADGPAGQLLDKRLKWGCKCCQGCMGCSGTAGSLCCWEICCKGWDKARCDANRCPWWEYCS
ncbi:hypothetical protein QBC44DRAFT_310195 [Cladorrhinum sp. PSN332]|nr:hypothetical protein QBC44DRAFT_310195 [Cladorrhinum sp. PSN332]